MSNLRILKLLSENQLGNYLLERLPKQKTNYGRERLGGGTSAEAVIAVFNPQLKLMNNDWFKCIRRALEKLRKLNPSTSPHSAIIRNIFSEAHCRQTGSH
jgi:hypothetical protein